MLSYILSSGFSHLVHVDPRSRLVLESLESLGLDVRHHSSHWERLCVLREEVLGWPYPPWPSTRHDFVLYVLIAYCPSGLLRTFLSRCRSLQPRAGTNPLVYAADLQKTEHAMVLLACGADVNMRGLVVDDTRHASPLEVAIDLSEDVLVGEILLRGCTVSWEVISTAVCMPWCSTQVLAKLVVTDEFVDWAYDIGDERLYWGVFNSARPSARDSKKADEAHVTLARRLRQLGQDLSADSWFGEELIERALHAAHISMLEFLLPTDEPPPGRFLIAAATGDTSETVSVVRFLLDKGVDVHAVSDESGDTALHLAVMCSWEPRRLELATMLMDAGCSPHACNSQGETPLIVAEKRGYSSVAEILLSCNGPLPSNVLHLALHACLNPQVIQSLIQSGANIHAISGSAGNTVLHLAINEGGADRTRGAYGESECLDLVKSFINAGYDPTICNSSGESALEAAIKRRYTSVVDLLLSYNVPLPANILLFRPQQRANLWTILILVSKGAKVHFTTPDGVTVLYLSIAEYTEGTCLKLVKSLVNAGCDPTIRNSGWESALEATIEHRYPSVVDLLLSYNAPLPANILLFGLQQRTTLEIIRSLVSKGADVHSTTPNGDTVLHLSIAEYSEGTCLDLVKSLIHAGCNPTICNLGGESPLEAAFKSRYPSVVDHLLSYNFPLPANVLLFGLQHRTTLEIIRFLISKGAGVHSTTPNGDTVLHLSVDQYSEETCSDLVKCFVSAGCNPAPRNLDGKSVLEAAIKCRYTSVVDLLLSYNAPLPANILLFGLQQCTTLEIIRSLVSKGADMYSTTPNGYTALHLTIDRYSEGTCLDLFDSLINAGLDPTIRNSGGESPLEAAIKRRYTLMVDHLLLYNVPLPANVVLFGLQKCTTLKVIQSLVSKGADVRSTTSDGDTALHLSIMAAAEHDANKVDLDLVEYLINAGCDPAVRNLDGESVLEVAIEHQYTEVVDLLLSYNAPLPANILLFGLQKWTTLEIIRSLVSKGADVHSTTPNGDTVLHLSIDQYDEGTCLDLVKSFINAGCSPAACNYDGKSALEVAIECDYTSVVDILLSYNTPFPADILLSSRRRYTSLQMIQYLIVKGADVHSTTSNEDTLLHVAVANYYSEGMCHDVVKSLINAGCNPAACNSDGVSVLEAAVTGHCGYTSVVELLLLHNVPCSPGILSTAIRYCRSPPMIQLLVRSITKANTTVSGSDWDTLIRLAREYYVEETRQQVVDILDAAREACREPPGPTDDTPVHVAKRPRRE